MKLNTNVQKARLRLTSREYRLILMLAILVEIFLFGFYIVMPKWTEYNAEHSKAVSTIQSADSAQMEFNSSAKLAEQDKKLVEQLLQLGLKLPAFISQENIILELSDNSKKSGIVIDSLAFGDSTVLSKDEFIKKSNAAADKQAVPAQNSKQPDSSISPVVKNQEVTVNFSGNYKAMYDFINGIEENTRKISINDLTVMRSADDIVKGTVKLTYNAYSEPGDKDVNNIEVPVYQGKDNIFISYAGYSDPNGSASKSAVAPSVKNPDFYIILNQYNDNAQKIIMGAYGKTGTEIYSVSNAQAKGKLLISEKNGKLTGTYTLGNSTKTFSAYAAPQDGIIRFQVISQPKISKDDDVGVVMDVENKTHYRLEISNINDNKDAPRFVLGNKSGTISIVK